MPTKDLVQVVSYIHPSLKDLADIKIHANGHRLSMSAYIERLIRRDLTKKKGAA